MRPLNPKRVSVREGKFSYLETWNVIAYLNMIFGFDGWSKEVTRLELVFEEEKQVGKWTVCYRCVVRLSAGDKVSEDVATGDATNQPSRAGAHDLAIKSAVSDALKRAAKDLGDMWGLCLYNNGSTDPTFTTSAVYDIPESPTGDGEAPRTPQEPAEDPNAPTKPQLAKIAALAREKGIDRPHVATKAEASATIERLLALPAPTQEQWDDEPF